MQEIFNFTQSGMDFVNSLEDFFVVDWVISILFLAVGFMLIKRFTSLVRTFFKKKDYDPSLETFLTSIFDLGLKIVLIITALSMAGVPTASMITIVGALGVGLGLAMEGTISNFAGGAILLTFKPLEVGDYVKVGEVHGTVRSIQIFYTVLITPDNKRITIPNGMVADDALINYTTEGKRRMDTTVGIGYGDDLKLAKEVLLKIAANCELIFDDPEPAVVVEELGDSSVNLRLMPWANAFDYLDVKAYLFENIKLEFDKAGIEIPYPHNVVISKSGNETAVVSD